MAAIDRNHRCQTALLQRWWRLLAVFGMMLSLSPQAAVPWQHTSSPYRSRYSTVTKPSHERAGTMVSVPARSLGRDDGGDLFAFDAQGRQLQLLALGPGPRNLILALVSAQNVDTEFYVYFGSGLPSPQNRTGFLPSLFLNVRTLKEPRLDDWKQVSKTVADSADIGTIHVETIALRHNPLSAASQVLLDFQGYLMIPQDDDYTYMLVSDDAGFLFIDDKLLISRPGTRNVNDALLGQDRGTVRLAAGPHAIRCVVANAGGAMAAVVARYFDPRNKQNMKPEDFIQPGQSNFVEIQMRNQNLACPAFTWEFESYLGFNDQQLTSVVFQTLDGSSSAEWLFSDGGKASGQEVRHIFHGLEARQVKVRAGLVTATGIIHFPQAPPAQWSINNQRHFEHYARTILAEDLKGMETKTLEGYRQFLRYREYNPQLVPVCEALLTRTAELPAEQQRAVLLDLARSAAGTAPATAERAYSVLASASPAQDAQRPEMLMEFARFALLQLHNPELANRLAREVARLTGPDNWRVLQLRTDLALYKKDLEPARQLFSQLQRGAGTGRNLRLAVVKSNALKERVYDLLQQGFIQDADQALTAWGHLAPNDRMSGSWGLARAQLLKAMNMPKAALTVLELDLQLNPMLPNLPEVELLQAELLRQNGQSEQALEKFRHIIKEYPNHPAAEQARRKIP